MTPVRRWHWSDWLLAAITAVGVVTVVVAMIFF